MAKENGRRHGQLPLKESEQEIMDKHEVGQNVAKARDRMDMTQADLARKIGADATKISKIERGNRNIHMSTFFALAAALRVTPNELGPHRLLAGTPLEFYGDLTFAEQDMVKSLISSLLKIRTTHDSK